MARPVLLPGRRPRRPSVGESLLGAALVLLLALAVALFLLSGRGAGPPTLPTPTAGGEATAGRSTTVETGLLPPTSPSGWACGRVERYDGENLFEKIDGKADSYLAYDFVALHTASYVDPDLADDYVDVYLYEMGSPLDAFGIYRAQRPGGEAALGFGEEGAAHGGALFFRQGSFYLEVVASGAATHAEARALAEALSRRLPPAGEPVLVPQAFPRAGLRVIRFDRLNVLGVEALQNAFVAVYEDGSQLVRSEAPDEDLAQRAVKDAHATFEFLGDPASFAARGTFVVGVVGVPDVGRREALLAALAAETARVPR